VYEGTDETIFPAYVIEHARGIPVGIIGIVYEGTPSIVTASGVAGLEFLPEAEAVNNAVAELKAKGVKAIIVLMHNGGYGSDTGGPITGDIVPIIEAMDDEVASYRGGKAGLIGFFVGQVMREMRGQGNPAVVNEVLRRKLG
jgi:5'-nucleotidase